MTERDVPYSDPSDALCKISKLRCVGTSKKTYKFHRAAADPRQIG